MITGEPGIGKTRLLSAGSDLARAAGLTILRARGVESEQGFPFAGALQLLEAPVAVLVEDRRGQYTDYAGLRRRV